MRRSGSSSCMLRPKSEVDLTKLAEEQLSVTIINKNQLPTYSTERFYMLSELEVNSHSTVFLCDYSEEEQPCDETLDTAESSEASVLLETPPSAQASAPTHGQVLVDQQTTTTTRSPFIILYMLWRPDSEISNVEDFASGPIQRALRHYKNFVESTAESSARDERRYIGEQVLRASSNDTTTPSMSSSLYLVIDTLVVQQQSERTEESSDTDTAQDHPISRQERFQAQVDVAEKLARHVTHLPEVRSAIEGVTIGVSDHERAAPGLELCLDAVSFGSRTRRKHSKDIAKKSLLQMVCPFPEDLLGVQSEEITDAAQGVLQTRIVAEWHGLGNIQSFARRAHKTWCKDNNVIDQDANDEAPRSAPPRRRARRSRFDDDLDRVGGILPPMESLVAYMMILLVLVHLGLSVWNVYDDVFVGWWYQSEPVVDAGSNVGATGAGETAVSGEDL